ncbi:isoprenoid synthase domain-containing protein, partial [Blyttiomyces helicus]
AFVASAFHPTELAALVQFKLSAPPKKSYPIQHPSKDSESSDPLLLNSYAECYSFLDKTSRSFARVIQELHQDLRHPVCIFYLVLRGLDTIEDDMTLDIDVKVPLLKSFHKTIQREGWTFDGNGPEEKDRHLLVRFDVVIKEFLALNKSHREVITDITRRMGNGMADMLDRKIDTLADYALYTHYVAGLVGIGLTRLFVSSGLESPSLIRTIDPSPPESPTGLANEMGLFLQKTNIMKDYLQDIKEGRLYWPREIWGLYVPKGEEVDAFARPENLERGVACLNHLVADALELVPSCLEYLALLKEKSVFQFCAIPQMMAIATISHFYNNPALFQRSGNKIRRGLAVKLMLASTDIESVKRTYLAYALDINRRNGQAIGSNPFDDTFLRISLACSQV